VCLETITGMPPRVIPYLEPESDFWRLYPEMPARSLARFVRLAKRSSALGIGALEQVAGSPGPDTPAEVAAQMRAQQLDHFAASVRYARESLGLGERETV
jgi:hypothetical protein